MESVAHVDLGGAPHRDHDEGVNSQVVRQETLWMLEALRISKLKTAMFLRTADAWWGLTLSLISDST